MIVSDAEMIQHNAGVAQFLIDDDGYDADADIAISWKRLKLRLGRGRSIVDEKSEYERRHDAADEVYQSVRQSHDPEMWKKFTETSEQGLD